ncbi:MAG: NADH-quinone oxidoreductase subunit J [Nitriliruptoraceae bacterium]
MIVPVSSTVTFLGPLPAEVVAFWLFAVLALGSAIAVIAMRDIVHGALMLVINLLAIAGLYLTLESSFLSIIQVLVYGGAIMVLFLFVIMLLGVHRDDLLLARARRTWVLAAVAGIVLSAALLLAFVGTYTGPGSVCGPDVVTDDGVRCVGLEQTLGDDRSGVAFLGLRLFTRFTYPFELSALLLTVATIGAVILARRRDLEPEDLDDTSRVLVDGPADGDVPPDPTTDDTDDTGVSTVDRQEG